MSIDTNNSASTRTVVDWDDAPKPKQPKQLTQAVFDGLPPEYRWAAVDSEGRAYAHKCMPKGATEASWWCVRGCAVYLIGEGYDTTDWQNSLIERETENPVSEQNQPVERKHSHYFKDVSGVDQIDLYHVAKLYEINDPALFHAFKKIACAGKRGAKDQAQDVQEAIDALKRWQELNK